MPQSTLLFVHGTGVRNASYSATLDEVKSKAAEFGLPCKVEHLLWGDVYGIDFAGQSLPEPLQRTPNQEAQALRWEYLQVDPLFDLKLWCTPAGQTTVIGGGAAAYAWEDTISTYPPSDELLALLRRNGIEQFFTPAWTTISGTKLPQQAFKGAGNEDAAVARVFAEAVVAQMMHDATAATPAQAIPNVLAEKIVNRLLFDWKQMGKSVKDLLQTFFGKATKTVLRPLRSGASRAIAPAIGDILAYQQAENGGALRKLIHTKIEKLPKPVFVFSHSLGGIACFEAMVEARPPQVAGLITAGSQAPLLHEFGALSTLAKDAALPAHFPPWLNLYDENDLLSYRANLVFGCSADQQVDSMLPPLEAHSAYWKLDATWVAIREFMEAHG